MEVVGNPLLKKQKTSHALNDEPQEENYEDIPNFSQIGNLISNVLHARTPQTHTKHNFPFPDGFWSRSDVKAALRLVFDYLNFHSISMCSRVCSSWNEITNESSLWRSLYLDYFCSSTREASSDDWREECKRIYSTSREFCMFGGNPWRNHVFYSKRKRNAFVPPMITFTNPIVHYFDRLSFSRVFIYRNYIFLLFESEITAFDLTTSVPLWSFTNNEKIVGSKTTIMMDKTKVYCLDETGSISALDLITGKLIWKQNEKSVAQISIADNDTESTDIVGLDSHGYLCTFHKDNGKLRHTIETTVLDNLSILQFHDNKYYWLRFLGNFSSVVVACPKQKKIIFEADSKVPYWIDCFRVHKDSLYCTCYTDKGGLAVIALELDFHKNSTTTKWIHTIGIDFICMQFATLPIFHNGLLWVLTCFQEKDDLEASLVALNAITGKEEHKIRFHVAPDPDVDEVELNHYVIDDILYYSVMEEKSATGRVGAVDTTTGEWLWRQSFKHEHYVRHKGCQAAVHSNIKGILGASKENIMFLYHPL